MCRKDIRGVHETGGRYSVYLLKNQRTNPLECTLRVTQEVRRSRFEEFYLSMIKDNYGDPHFEVKNYLFKDEINILTDQDIFLPIVESV